MNYDQTKQMPFPSQEFTIQGSSKSFNFLCPANPDDVLDSIREEQYEKDKFLPYWVENWPSAQVLFPFIENTAIEPNTRICELGCGLGVISAALSTKSPYIISLDISPDACIFCNRNMHRNGAIPRVIASDWRAIAFKTQFDLVVASDILYEQRWITPVLDCIKALLKPEGKAWIADPCRRFWEQFKQSAVQNGFSTNILHQEKTNNGKTQVEILELKIFTK